MFSHVEAYISRSLTVLNLIFLSANTPTPDGTPCDFKINYDDVVVAVVAIDKLVVFDLYLTQHLTSTFGTPGVYEHCHFLKEISGKVSILNSHLFKTDATAIRKKIIDCFEVAALPGKSPEEIQRLLNFVVVGGGPNGVEFA